MMLVPGSNLLNLAHSLIGFQTITLYRNQATVNGADGVNEPIYQPPVTVKCSVQEVPTNFYQLLGLDLLKDYLLIYSSVEMKDLRRDKCPDALDFNGFRYVVESNVDWRSQDGWAASVCVNQGRSP
jgi:hypothetical protein